MSTISKKVKVGLLASLVVGCVGIGAWVYQLMQGMQVTGLDTINIWGLTIAVFFAIVASGAGLLALCGVSEFVEILDKDQKKLAIAVAFVALIIGGMLVLMDLGNPAQFMHLVTSFNLTSYTVWDFWLLSLCMISAIVYFVLAYQGKSTKVVGVISFVLAVSVIVVEGLLLANNTSHHLWASSMSVISFLAGAFLGGSALLVIIEPANKRLLLIALIASALITLAEVGTSMIVGTDMMRATMASVVAGPFAPYFFLQIIVGLIIPLVILLAKKPAWIAGVCAIVGIAAEKLWFLCAGQAEIWTQMHHIGGESPGMSFGYVPTFIEVLITVGAFALGVFLFLLIRSIVLKPSSAE